ncbi:hypothetical protein JTB14_024901 [Gonioctena quinquepunctata]|nr:hypothetical protein JTB14_024901 [Gonioctena quinquepunctata]
MNTDKKATGNKKIILKDWEETLLEITDGDVQNPVFHKMPGAVSMGIAAHLKSTKINHPFRGSAPSLLVNVHQGSVLVDKQAIGSGKSRIAPQRDRPTGDRTPGTMTFGMIAKVDSGRGEAEGLCIQGGY